jgi:pimeloyl-ACP methyl ester carboxylesterase
MRGGWRNFSLGSAEAAPAGLRAVNVGITRLVDPRALFREDASMSEETDPPIRSLLARLEMPRWYLIGEHSDPERYEAELAALGMGWKVVPGTGHPMGLQNPVAFAQAIADVLGEVRAGSRPS